MQQMTFDEYRAIDAINASALKAGKKSTLHMKAYLDGLNQKETTALTAGRKAHLCVLEPDLFFSKLVKFDGDKRKKEWKEFKAVNDPDFIVTGAELNQFVGMRDALHSNADAHDLINCTEHEGVMVWDHKLYGKGKARFDGYSQKRNIIVEYKTTIDASQKPFQNQACRLGYDVGCGWYSHGVEVLTGAIPDYYFIVQEKEPPYDNTVMEVPHGTVKLWIDKAVEIARTYHASRVTGTYTGVAKGQRLQFEVPEWAQSDWVVK